MSYTRTALKAKDIMTPEPVCVEPGTTLRALARVFEENEISGAPVVDRQGKLVGVVSKTDMIQRCTEGDGDVPPAYLFEILREQGHEGAPEIMPEPLICVDDFMTADPVTATLNTPADELARAMFEGHFHRIVVVDEEHYPIGIVTSMDLLGVFPRDHAVSP